MYADMDSEFQSFFAAIWAQRGASQPLDKRMVSLGMALLDMSREESVLLLAAAVAHLLETEEWGTGDD